MSTDNKDSNKKSLMDILFKKKGRVKDKGRQEGKPSIKDVAKGNVKGKMPFKAWK